MYFIYIYIICFHLIIDRYDKALNLKNSVMLLTETVLLNLFVG